MVKRCQWGVCDTDSRYPERMAGGVKFVPFPKPRRSRAKCLRWIKACNRPHEQLNVEKIDKNYHLYVCTKHFPDGGPTEEHPDPLTAEPAPLSSVQPTRKQPQGGATRQRKRLMEVPCKTEVQTDTTSSYEPYGQVVRTEGSPCSPSNNSAISPLDLLALAAENRVLTEQLGSQILQNEQLRRDLKEKTQPSFTSS